MEKRKGLSPLIAAVILIAATMTIAGILAFWVSSFVVTELEEAEEAGITGGAKCLGAQFEIYSGSYDGNTLHFILDNKKSTDLYLTNIFLIYPNNDVVPISLNKTLKGNEIDSVTVSGVAPNFLTGEIKTNCPDVSAFFTYEQISSMQTTTTTTSSTTTTLVI